MPEAIVSILSCPSYSWDASPLCPLFLRQNDITSVTVGLRALNLLFRIRT